VGAENFRDITLTINAASGESNIIFLGATNTGSSGISSITIPAPRSFTVFVVGTKYYIHSSSQERSGVVDHLSIIPFVTASYSGTAISLDKNKRYNISASSPAEVVLPDISTLSNYGDFIEITQTRTVSTPNYITVNLSATDAAASVIFSGLGFVRSNQTSIDSIKIPLTTGILRITKVSNTSWSVQLIQNGYGNPVVLNTAGTYSYDLDLGMTYVVDTDTIGGNVTLNLPYPYDEMISTQTSIKILTDTYSVTLDPESNSTIDESSTITLPSGSSALKTLNVTPYAQGKYLVLSNLTNASNGWTYSAITADPADAQAGYHYSCTGTFTITLPTSGVSAGEEIRIKNTGTGTITIDPQTATIDGSATDYTMDIQYSAITLVSTGTNWEII
jgi:hypothetical protein